MGSIMKRGQKFYLRYVENDGTERTKLAKGATTKAEVKPMLAEVERRIMNGQLGIPERVEETPEAKLRRTITVEELGEKFLTEYAPPRIKDIEQYRREAKSKLTVRVYPTLGKRPVISLRTIDVERLRDKLLAGSPELGKLAPRSVMLTLAVLSKMFNWARRAGYADCANPATGVERPQAEPSLDYLSRDEVTQLLAHVEEHALNVHPMVAAAIYTGMRKGELFGLRSIDVNEDASRVDVMHSYRGSPKSGKSRSLPLHPTLATLLRAWRKRCPATKEGLVFPIDEGRGARMGDDGDMLGLGELMVAAKCHVPAKPWHSLRHTFASHAVMAGASLYDVQKLLGHSTPSMTQIYAKLAPDHLLARVARMSFAQPVAGVRDLGEERRRRLADDGTGVVQTVTDGPSIDESERTKAAQ